jgi:Ca2+-binding EF-hand superfamily protein
MGQKIPTAGGPRYNFNQFGLSSQEINKLQDYYSQFAGRDAKLNYSEFKNIYTRLNPDMIGPQLEDLAERAFMASDKDRNGFIDFDEFIAFYVMNKSNPENFRDNMYNLLNTYHADSGYISPNDALQYTNWTYNYTKRPRDVPEPNQLMQKFEQFGDRIPLEHFVNGIAPVFADYLI